MLEFAVIFEGQKALVVIATSTLVSIVLIDGIHIKIKKMSFDKRSLKNDFWVNYNVYLSWA